MTRRGGPLRFRTGDPVSVVVGLWPVLEALRHRPAAVASVAWHPELRASDRARLIAASGAAGVPAAKDAGRVERERRSGTSQGAAFAVRHAAWSDWTTYRRTRPRHAVLAFTPPAGSARPLADLAPPTPAAWAFGPEGGAFPSEALDGAARVTIPQDPDLESHNLAVAVGVALYARALARASIAGSAA